jgi:hypothetical protein
MRALRPHYAPAFPVLRERAGRLYARRDYGDMGQQPSARVEREAECQRDAN